MYVWGPNRDSGSVRRHRNPDTKRRYNGKNVPHIKAHGTRHTWSTFFHANKAALLTGEFDVSVSRVTHGWDDGDPLETNPVLDCGADPSIDEVEYPEVPDWLWDQLYADTIGICGPLCDKRCPGNHYPIFG